MFASHCKSFLIGSADTDFNGCLYPAVLLSHMQDIATEHAGLQNIGRDYLISHYHACWILARTWYHLDAPIKSGDTIDIVTSHCGAKSLLVSRDFAIYREKVQIGSGTQIWVIADIETRKMIRPDKVENMAFAEPGSSGPQRPIKVIPDRKEKSEVFKRKVRYSDLDVNGHMNNTKYASVILDAFSQEEMTGEYISEVQINYSMECCYGDAIIVNRKDEGDRRYYIDGCDGNGKRHFESVIQLSQIHANI